VRRADTISDSAREYYEHRKNLLTRQHEIELKDRETKMRWKEERHHAKMQLLHLKMTNYTASVCHTPQNTTPSVNHTHFSIPNMYGQFQQL
jgi:hypothetical protein